jgi:small subunit ribosomal protein S21
MTMVERQPGESFESMLKRFRKKVSRDRIKSELKKRRYFLTKGEQRRIAKRKGERRARRRRRRARRRRYMY